jgi:hypothetical protein
MKETAVDNWNICSKCGKQFWWNSKTTSVTPELCDCITENKPYNHGWTCPICGCGLSPYTSICPCNQKWEITYKIKTELG